VLLAPLEALFRLATRSRPLPGSRGTFLLSIHPYRGRPVSLDEGARVEPGDLVAEIHFWNDHIAAYAAQGTGDLTWRFLRDLRADLRTLAAAVAQLPAERRPRAVLGVTPLADGATRLGFEVRALPGGFERRTLSAWQGRVLGRVFRPIAGRARSAHQSQQVWLTYERLQRRFGSQATG
jgi:hypothetical protein